MLLSKNYIGHYKAHLLLALPVVGGQLGHVMVGVADTIMAGRLSGVAMAAVSIATSFFVPFMSLGLGITYGSTPLIAKAVGQGDQEEIRRVFKHSLVMNSLMALLLFLLIYLSTPVLRMLNQPKEVVEMSVSFAQWLAWTIIPIMFFQNFKQFAEGLSHTRQAMMISVSANVINILLIYVFTEGWFGIAPMGLNGIALATLVARILMALAMAFLIFSSPLFAPYRTRLNTVVLEFKTFRTLIWMSIPIGLQLILESGAFAFSTIMVGWLGTTEEIDAHQIALSLATISYMISVGLGAAATVRVGNELGRKDYHQLRSAGYSAMILGGCFMVVTALLFVNLRFILPGLYIAEEEIVQMAASLLLIVALFQFSDGLQAVTLGALRGIGDVFFPTSAVLVAYWIIGLPVGYWLAFTKGYGLQGIWYGLLLGLALVSTFLLFRFRTKTEKLLKPER
jgi:MATE family multidrug resistance protein